MCGKPAYDRPAILAVVLSEMRTGKSLRSICSTNTNFPTESTFREWIVNDEPAGCAAQYARAREALVEAWSDQIEELSATRAEDNAHAQSLRLQVDTKKWLMSKIAPKRYGERLELAGDATQPLRVEYVRTVVQRHANAPAD